MTAEKTVHSGAVFSSVASQQERIEAAGSWWSLHVLPLLVWVLSGFSGFLPQSKDRLIVDSKMAVGLNVGVNSCLSLCVRPAMDWRPGQGVNNGAFSSKRAR